MVLTSGSIKRVVGLVSGILLSLLTLSACSPTPSSPMEGWWANQRWAEAQDNSEADM